VNHLEVRNCDIDARRDDRDNHNLYDITAFNTDGYDVTGRDVWIHDCSVWCQDDTIAVKDDSQDMVFERITASGVGLTIGSIGNSLVKNITFRDIYMHDSYKGIYMKFRGDGGTIQDVTYENIHMESPSQWPICEKSEPRRRQANR
jgi:polygalacturonase